MITVIFLKIIPFYLLILLGFLAGKYKQVKKESIASLLIYIISPLVVFYGVTSNPKALSYFPIALIIVALAAIVSLLTIITTSNSRFGDARNLLGLLSGSGNTGYFGIPIALALFGDKALLPAIMGMLGTVIFQFTIGYFLLAKHQFPLKKVLKKVFSLPTVISLIISFTVVLIGLRPPEGLLNFLALFKSTYSVLGMMVLGLSLSELKHFHLCPNFFLRTLLGKFILSPLFMYLLIIIDQRTFHFIDKNLYSHLMLLALVPIASNVVSLSIDLKVHPDRSTLAVIYSTLLSIAIIPIFLAFFSSIL